MVASNKQYLIRSARITCLLILYSLSLMSVVWGQETRGQQVSTLIRKLKDKDASVRSNAALELGRIGPEAKAAVPDLSDALKEKDANVRREAALALGRIGPEAKAAIPDLINALEDQEISALVAYSVGQISVALSKAKETDAIDLLRKAHESLRNSQDPAVKRHADTVKAAIDALESLWWRLWWSKFTNWIYEHRIVSVAIAVYPVLFLALLALLWMRPLWLLHINAVLPDSSDIKLP